MGIISQHGPHKRTTLWLTLENNFHFMNFSLSAFQGVPDGHDVQVRAGAGSLFDPEGPGQHRIRSECPL